jgi:hypothetical protein
MKGKAKLSITKIRLNNFNSNGETVIVNNLNPMRLFFQNT